MEKPQQQQQQFHSAKQSISQMKDINSPSKAPNPMQGAPRKRYNASTLDRRMSGQAGAPHRHNMSTSPLETRQQTEMRSASNVALQQSGSSVIAPNARLSKVQVKRMGPDFAERSAKVVSKYSYTMPKNVSMSAQKQPTGLKSLRQETSAHTLDVSQRQLKNLPQSPFMSKVAEELALDTFNNDRGAFFNQHDEEQASIQENYHPVNKMARLRTNIPTFGYPKQKSVVYRPGNLQNHPALIQKQNRAFGSHSSVVGPTIKTGSRLHAYFPDISKRGGDIDDHGENEPLVRSVSKAMDEGDSREIDGIHFWTATSAEKDLHEITKRRLSLSMLDRQQPAQTNSRMVTHEQEKSKESTIGTNSMMSRNRKQTIRDKNDTRRSKQELCYKLSSLERNPTSNDDRVSRLYAMLQSTDKGANRIGKNSKNFFNENIKMNHDQSQRLDQVNKELRFLTHKSVLNNKDSLSRLSEAIDLFKSQKSLKTLESVSEMKKISTGVVIKQLNTKDSEIQLQSSEVVIPEETERQVTQGSYGYSDKSPAANRGNKTKWLSVVPSAKQLLAKESPYNAAKMAFDLNNHREQNLDSESAEERFEAPDLVFKDNIHVEDFVRLSSINQYRFNISLRQFDKIQTMSLPYAFDGPNLRRVMPEESQMTGFWQKLLLNGSGQPIARENSTLMPTLENGQPVLYLFGGAPMITGQFLFEIYKISPFLNSWSRVEYERPIVQTIGSRPVYQCQPQTKNFNLYFFSGMVPLQRINSGVKVCPPDMQKFDSKTMRWHRIKSQGNNQAPIIGRKNFAMSFCDDYIFVTGGMDNGQNLLQEFLTLNPQTGAWLELRQVRKKDKRAGQSKMGMSNAGETSQFVSAIASVQNLTRTLNSPKAANQMERQNTVTFNMNNTSPEIPKHQANPNANRKRLLRRSHHTMNTIKGHTEKLRNGYKMDHYVSYVFGGLIQEDDGRFCPTNDLVEVVSKQVVLDKSQLHDVENPIKPSLSQTQADETTVTLLTEQGGIRPLPRRDHQAILITKNQYLLIYGGKNDNSFMYSAQDMPAPERLDSARIKTVVYNEITNSALDDIMLLHLESMTWSAVAQRGWKPEARWSAAICYQESSQQLFIFGGTGAHGSCRNDVYCCELNPNKANFKMTELQNHIRDIGNVKNRMRSQFLEERMQKQRDERDERERSP